MITALRAFCFVLLTWGFGGDGEFIPLVDGEILVGEISSHDEDGIEVKPPDTGGGRHLPWAPPAAAVQPPARGKPRYTLYRAEEGLREADQPTFADGTKKVGRIVDQTPERIVIK